MHRKSDWSLKQQLEDGRTIAENGCWLWRTASKRGYGKLSYFNKTLSVHRASAHIFLGLQLESVLQALHKCSNKHCFNPDHLYIGNQSQNMLDAVAARTHSKARNTHCTKGHPFDIKNTQWYTSKEGWRIRFCRQCSYKRVKEWKQQKRLMKVMEAIQ